MSTESYIIRGGVDGFDRLRVLARSMHGVTCGALDRTGVGPGMHCLDLGCGSGDVSFELARRVGATGRVLGVDLDEVKLDLARREADVARVPSLEFVRANANELEAEGQFDLVYARFLLSHLTDPFAAVKRFRELLRPGGVLLVEDVDFAGYFCLPPSAAHDRYVEL